MAKTDLTDAELENKMAEVLRLQADLTRKGGFFLAGGTGLALRLRHRFSDDLDWFTPMPFDSKQLIAKLRALPRPPTATRQDGTFTVRAFYDKVETSFITYSQVPAHPEILRVAGTEIAIADVPLQAAMKAAVLHDRGARRDFIDVHAISGLPGWSVSRFIEHSARQLPLRSRPSRSPARSPTSLTRRKSRCPAVARCPGPRSGKTSKSASESGSARVLEVSTCERRDARADASG